jgi:hypothetical protein
MALKRSRGKPPIEQHWVDRIRYFVANNRGKGSKWIQARIEEEAEDAGREDFPSLSTVKRYVKDARSKPQELVGYKLFYWPESMSVAELPWESSALVLELVALLARRGKRPSVGEVKWFWRVTQAAPSAPTDVRYDVAWNLAMLEAMGGVPESQARLIETYLAQRGWETGKAWWNYEAGTE